MSISKWIAGIGRWPVLEQVRRGDWTALGDTARSPRSAELVPRTQTADRVVRSVCPYCAVGCGQLVFVHWDEKITDIEGDPRTPPSLRRLPVPQGRRHPSRPGHRARTGLKERASTGEAGTAPSGRPSPWNRAMEMSGPAGEERRGKANHGKRSGRRAARRSTAGGWGSPPIWAGRRSTTRRITSSRSCSRARLGSSRSRTRPEI